MDSGSAEILDRLTAGGNAAEAGGAPGAAPDRGAGAVVDGLLQRLTGRSAAEMPFLDHLEEFRRRLLASVAAWLLLSIAGYAVSGWLLDYIVCRTSGRAQFLHPMEAFNARLKLALLCGGWRPSPFVSFQLWSFVLPGLYARERRVVLRWPSLPPFSSWAAWPSATSC